MSKKLIVIITIFILIILAAVYFSFNLDFSQSSPVVLTGNYDIQRDYCGKVIDSHYCRCAFQGEDCEKIGIGNKEVVHNLVIAGYQKWLLEMEEKECIEKGGNWTVDKCEK